MHDEITEKFGPQSSQENLESMFKAKSDFMMLGENI